LATNERLRGYVEDKLGGEEHWSPKQVSLMLPREFPDDEAMRISPETIYQSLFVQARGQLKVGLTSSLRTGRAVRKPRGLSDGRGRIKDMVSISERPAEVADRAVPGHWEGDLIMGKNGKSAVGTLVERTTRYVILLHLPGSKDPVAVRDAIVAAMLTLPAQLRKSLTWDRGMELNRHADLKIQAGLDVYFCDPASPWQRGSNENTNGLLRQYLPKGTDLSVHSADDLARIAAALNRRPRETLGMKRPVEALTELISEHQQTTGVATTT
jgi:IS30 family transposase